MPNINEYKEYQAYIGQTRDRTPPKEGLAYLEYVLSSTHLIKPNKIGMDTDTALEFAFYRARKENKPILAYRNKDGKWDFTNDLARTTNKDSTYYVYPDGRIFTSNK